MKVSRKLTRASSPLIRGSPQPTSARASDAALFSIGFSTSLSGHPYPQVTLAFDSSAMVASCWHSLVCCCTSVPTQRRKR